MWTLTEARDRLGDRLAEASTVFWDVGVRNDAINEAVRFIAAVTKGVPTTITGNVDTTTPFVAVANAVAGDYATAGYVDGGEALRFVPITSADIIFPGWRTYAGTPRWAIVDSEAIYLSPVPSTSTAVTVKVAVIPDEVIVDSDELFLGEAVMEKYLGPMLNVAAALCLLRERYDGDAERFYQFAITQLQAIGTDPARIPSIEEMQTK